jgi:PAS domain-containing protein
MRDIAIIQVDPAGKICLWSAGAEKLLRRPASEAIGQALDIIVPESFREAHWKGFHAAMARRGTQGDSPFVLPVLCGDGAIKHLGGRLMYLRDAYDEPVGAMAIFVTEKQMPAGQELYRL